MISLQDNKVFLREESKNTDLVDLSAGLKMVALIMAAEKLECLIHMVPGILNLTE